MCCLNLNNNKDMSVEVVVSEHCEHKEQQLDCCDVKGRHAVVM